ncbi:hypothetical protein K469DRAFT_688129 [Zopfia rhizophila CBS 207.26]|uniref:Uncharacterized protein n=1 Tax=Zopfia rhizophila CBS 207.26 TaxID=1314779 RepID=A0A6A6E492_9PEZI|nr:hypothetical protein K469DRAFT_688129 [Zopfia rhizophila CBS 207.26]
MRASSQDHAVRPEDMGFNGSLWQDAIAIASTLLRSKGEDKLGEINCVACAELLKSFFVRAPSPAALMCSEFRDRLCYEDYDDRTDPILLIQSLQESSSLKERAIAAEIGNLFDLEESFSYISSRLRLVPLGDSRLFLLRVFGLCPEVTTADQPIHSSESQTAPLAATLIQDKSSPAPVTSLRPPVVSLYSNVSLISFSAPKSFAGGNNPVQGQPWMTPTHQLYTPSNPSPQFSLWNSLSQPPVFPWLPRI